MSRRPPRLSGNEAAPEADPQPDELSALRHRLVDLEWRYCLAQDEIRQLSDVVRAESEVVATLQARLERMERRLARAAAADDGLDGPPFGDDWPEG